MTDKQTVIRQHPKAVCIPRNSRQPGYVKHYAVILTPGAPAFVTDTTADDAWKAAAEKLNQAADQQTEPG